MSPELLAPAAFGLKESRPTKESDYYALGMVIYEVLSGKIPFAQCSYSTVPFRILNGERPSRPQGEEGIPFTDEIWGTLELCWKPQPRERTNARDVLLNLEGNPFFDVDEDVGTDNENQLDTTASDSSTFPPISSQNHL